MHEATAGRKGSLQGQRRAGQRVKRERKRGRLEEDEDCVGFSSVPKGAKPSALRPPSVNQSRTTDLGVRLLIAFMHFLLRTQYAILFSWGSLS